MSRVDKTGIAAQTDINTVATAPSYGIPVVTESLTKNQDTIDINETLGSRGPSTSEYGIRFFEGTMSGAVRPVSFPLLLAAYLGAPASSGSAPYTHTFDPLAITYPVPLTVWGVNRDQLLNDALGVIATPIISQFIGAVGNSMTISAEVNNYLLFEGTVAAKAADVDATVEPSITQDTSRKWAFNQIDVEMALGAGTYADTFAQSFSWVFNNNLITDLGRLGSLDLWDLPLGPEIESTLTVNFLSGIPDHYRRAFEDSPTRVKLKLTGTGALIAGADFFTFSLEFPYLETVTAPIERSGADTLRTVEVTFNVVTDPATGKMVIPSIKNSTAGTLYSG
jgi:hypothetical protein